MIEKEWRPYDWSDRLVEHRLLPTDPSVDLAIPQWARDAMVVAVVLLALAIFAASLLPQTVVSK